MGAEEKEVEEMARRAALFCPFCGSQLETLILVKKTYRGSLTLRFYPSSYCRKCDVFRRRESSLKRCGNCGSNIIGVRITQPGEFCWICGSSDLKYLSVDEERMLVDRIKFSNNIAISMNQILSTMQRIERCIDGTSHRFPFAQIKLLEGVFYELVCTKCHQSFIAYSLALGG
jgi:hypothetical protein